MKLTKNNISNRRSNHTRIELWNRNRELYYRNFDGGWRQINYTDKELKHSSTFGGMSDGRMYFTGNSNPNSYF